ncbi:hypothetical protein QVD17_20592 [Tagetes erecta]|uniref:NLP1-9 GAF domain-containing protein n=1 Tax=Tagetes erecta TaxID=13708 RepID=A0AAD8KM07_TARER|nr:hypothetical protein QVD17_20592 [Tagetes erecta]
MMEDDTNDHWPEIDPNRTVVLPRTNGLQISEEMMKKIYIAFCCVTSHPLKRIVIQLWRRVKTQSTKTVLSCVGCPYALSTANARLCKYRSGCLKYLYSVGKFGPGNVDDAMTIVDAPPCHAAFKYFPEVVLDLSLHRGTPLVDLALECELTCFLMLPVFHQNCIVGVVEVSMTYLPDFALIFYELKCGLKRAGLTITPPLSYVLQTKPIFNTNPVLSEIKKAMQAAYRSHAITYGQVWLSFKTHCRDLLLKTSCVGDHVSVFQRFYQSVLLLPLKKEEGLVGRTLETYTPHLCRNIYKFRDIKGLLALLSADRNSNYTCFVICLRSSHTGELDHAFEFFWPQSRNHLALMEALLLTLREYLPSFKYVSGAQLGDDELLVIDVENSSSGSASESTPIKIFTGNEISKTPQPIEETVGMKRKSIYLHDDQSESSSANQHPLTNINNPKDDDDLVILAVHKVDHRLFFLPSSPTFENVMDKIKQEFKHDLNPTRTYKVKYQVLPGKWYALYDTACLKSCILSYQASKNIDYIKFYVVEGE